MSESPTSATNPPHSQPTSYPLENILQQYTGLFKIKRLLRIAEKTDQKNTAYRLALQLVQDETWNIREYESLCKLLEIDVDIDWMESTRVSANESLALANQQISRLNSEFHSSDQDLSSAYLEQARVFLKMGEYSDAQKSLRNQRDYSFQVDMQDHSNARVVDSALVSILLGQWPYARTVTGKHVAKEHGRASVKSQLFLGQKVSICLVYALSLLYLGDFEEAVSLFLADDNIFITSQESSQEKYALSTPADISIYIALIALATFSRRDLQYLVDKDPVLTKLLEGDEDEEQQKTARFVKNILRNFLNINYQPLFAELKARETDFLVDPFLGNRYHSLQTMIRQRAIIQYISVFDVLPLADYEQQFGPYSEEELVNLITLKNLPYRINRANQTIDLTGATSSQELFKDTEKTVKAFLQDSTLTIWGANARFKGIIGIDR